MTTQPRPQDNGKCPIYENSFEHITAELSKLDLLIERRVIVFRAALQAVQASDSNQHLYISHEEVDCLLHNGHLVSPHQDALAKIDVAIANMEAEIQAGIAHSIEQGTRLPLPQLARMFALSAFELQALVICLAPELSRKYDRLFAYLQDDITRKKPSVDLILDLLCPSESERWQARSLFTKNSPLFCAGLLHLSEDVHSPSGSSGLAQFLKIESRILNFILGNNGIDPRLHQSANYRGNGARYQGLFHAGYKGYA